MRLINTHWKRLQIGEDDDERVECSKEFNAIQIIKHFTL